MTRIFFFLLAALTVSASAQSYDEWIDSSFIALDANNLAQAEAALVNALRLEPANKRNALLWSNLGTIQRQAGKYSEAIESYTIALAQNPQLIKALQNRASLLGDRGKANEAITDYTAVLLIEPENREALYYRGLLYLQTEDYTLSEADFRKLMELNPESLSGRKGIATLEKLRKNYVEAEKIYNYLIEKYPNDRELYIARSELYLLTNRNARALGDVNKVIQDLASPDPYCYYLRAKIKLHLYEKQSAIKDLIVAKKAGYPLGDLEEFLKKEGKRE